MDRRRLVLIVAAVLAAVLLLLPQWSRARRLAGELERTRHELKFARLEGRLGAALSESLRSNYERARQLMVDFYGELQGAVGSVRDPEQRRALDAILRERDEIITLLARANQTSTQRLMLLYTAYFTAMDPAGRAAPAPAPAPVPPAPAATQEGAPPRTGGMNPPATTAGSPLKRAAIAPKPREGCAPGGPGTRRGEWADERGKARAPGRHRSRRGPGAVRHGGIVPYGARSPARSAAEGHAQIRLLKFHPHRSARPLPRYRSTPVPSTRRVYPFSGSRPRRRSRSTAPSPRLYASSASRRSPRYLRMSPRR